MLFLKSWSIQIFTSIAMKGSLFIVVMYSKMLELSCKIPNAQAQTWAHLAIRPSRSIVGRAHNAWTHKQEQGELIAETRPDLVRTKSDLLRGSATMPPPSTAVYSNSIWNTILYLGIFGDCLSPNRVGFLGKLIPNFGRIMEGPYEPLI